MKIIQSIDALYEERVEIIKKLKLDVDDTFLKNKSETWHYLSRIKSKESFALKLETGRFPVATELNDFFACTLVVENLDQIRRAQGVVENNFNVIEKKPGKESFTHKQPYSFEFDDLRIYAKKQVVDYLPTSPLSNIVFEIQIKTFLQHAWSIATHDLIYKSDEINWPKERIAFQVKAMLEQAEVAISGVRGLIDLPEVSKENPESKKLKKILSFYQEAFEEHELPKDLVRLCRNTYEFIKAVGIDFGEIRKIMKQETAAGRGTNLKNLSPFLLLIQSIILTKKEIIETYINSEEDHKFKLIIPKELEFGKMNIEHSKNIVKI